MPTTSRELATASLDVLYAANVRFAILHAADRLRAGPISDIDIVVDREPCRVLNRAAQGWRNRGLVPIVFNPYDIGGTAAVFLATPDATEGVQLDLLFDRRGVGRFGLRSNELVNEVSLVGDLPVVSHEASLVYQWLKRQWKRDLPRLESIADAAQSLGRGRLIRISTQVTGSAEVAEEMLARDLAIRRSFRDHPFLRFQRIVGRLANPVGHWAHVADERIATVLADRFGRLLVTARSGSVPRVASQPSWWATEVMPVRLRPGIYVSYGSMARLSTPDCVTEGSAVEESARQIVASMAQVVKERCAS